jgi:hypothetical protein
MLKCWWLLKHQFFDLSRLVGLRNRLRCPHCKSIGTWKPHGGWLDYPARGPRRRWLCKWCGWYENSETWDLAWPDSEKKVWVRKGTPEPTPKILVGELDPWRG